MSGNPIAPRILRGAFITFDQNPLGIGGGILNFVPMVIPFRLNPSEMQRSISVGYGSSPSAASESAAGASGGEDSMSDPTGGLGIGVSATNGESQADRPRGKRFLTRSENMTFDLILDVEARRQGGADPSEVDGESGGDEFVVTKMAGVLPELSALEMLTQPRYTFEQAADLWQTRNEALTQDDTIAFLSELSPPTTLMVWGYSRIMPCVITGLTIREQKFSRFLVPIRAEVSVQCDVLQVWELGQSLQNWLGYGYTQGVKQLMAAYNYKNSVAGLANTIVPF